jgi:exopolyphosphatase/guanosine-5'-triphosphate,3'-diphosphate pyrophosphatase
MCRLAEGLAETGELSQEGCRRTVEAMRRFRAVADAMRVERIDAIATEAVRRASNGAQLLAQIAKEAGFNVQVLSGAEEARFASLGVLAGFHQPNGVVGDMGGGSLEIAEISDRGVGDFSASMPLGALPVQALLAKSRVDAKQRVDAILTENLPPGLSRPVFYAVGGGWRAFARVHLASSAASLQVVNGYAINARDARGFAKAISRLSKREVATLPGIPASRIATLPAAALVMDRVLKALSPQRVIFSSLGVREGVLYSQLPPAEQALDPLLEGARDLGAARARVPEFASALVRWTDDLFQDETPAERRLRVAACALSDLAWRDHPAIQAAESFRRLIQFPFIGIDHVERVFLASTIHARYAGSAEDSVLTGASSLLSANSRRRALILGRVLLLGYRLSGSVPEILAGARLRIGTDSVRLEVSKAARVPDSEIVANRLKLVADAVGVRRTQTIEIV